MAATPSIVPLQTLEYEGFLQAQVSQSIDVNLIIHYQGEW